MLVRGKVRGFGRRSGVWFVGLVVEGVEEAVDGERRRKRRVKRIVLLLMMMVMMTGVAERERCRWCRCR